MNTNEINKIFTLIDQLLKMSGSKDDPTTLDIERKTIENELAHAKERLEQTKRLVLASKRFNPSFQNNQLIDQAIESKLVLYNHTLEMDIASKRSEISEKETELTALNRRLEENSRNIARSEDCIATLRARVSENESLDEQTLRRYQLMINKTNYSLGVLKAEETSINEKIAAVKMQITRLTEEIQTLQRVIATNNDLLSTTMNLPTEDMRENVKDEDDREIQARQATVDELEAKRKTILDNPSLIASKAKEALALDNDIPTTLSYARRLTEIVARMPFMELNYSEDFDEEIKALLQQAESDRDKLVSEIDAKDYHADNSSLEARKKTYLEERIASYRDAILTLRGLVNRIDSKNGIENTANVEQIDMAINSMRSDLESYGNINIDEVGLRESEILASSSKKQEQIASAEDLKASYELDVIADANTARGLEAQMEQIGLLIANSQAELNAIDSRQSLQRNTPEDTVAKAIDAQRKEQAINKVIAIKYRKRFKKSPSQIYSEIETIANTMLEPTEATRLEASPTPINTESSASLMSQLDKELKEGALKIDHILDLIQTTPDVRSNKTDRTFEPVTPIDFTSHKPEKTTLEEEKPKMASKIIDFEEVKRGNRVVDVTPIELEQGQKVDAVSEMSQNPFTFDDNETHLFDFDGRLLSSEEDNIIDFESAADEVHFGLGGMAA